MMLELLTVFQNHGKKKKQNENRSKTVVVPLVGTIYDNQIAFFIANIYVLNVYFSFCII